MGKRSLCPWNQPHFLRNSDKSLLFPEQNKSETRFCRRKTAEDNNVKINVSSNITCTFLFFKATPWKQNVNWMYIKRYRRLLNVLCTFNLCPVSIYVKFSFRGIYFSDKFWKHQFFSIVNVWHSFTSIENIKSKITHSFTLGLLVWEKTSPLQAGQPSASVNWDSFNFRLHEKFSPGLQG